MTNPSNDARRRNAVRRTVSLIRSFVRDNGGQPIHLQKSHWMDVASDEGYIIGVKPRWHKTSWYFDVTEKGLALIATPEKGDQP